MRVIIAAGGTGGHFYPGLSIAKEFQAQKDEVFFIVKKNDYVVSLLKREDIPFFEIAASGFERRLTWRWFATVLNFIVGFFQSLYIQFKWRPETLVAMGGYLSVSPALTAKILGIKIILHEQNLQPGLANRLLGRLAKRVAVSFPESQKFFPRNCILTGNPVRPEFKHLSDLKKSREFFKLNPGEFTFLIFGGSLGAHRVNELAVEAFLRLKKKGFKFQLLHVTGPKDMDWVRKSYEEAQIDGRAVDFCHEMAVAYSAADLIISRSGASTIAELLIVKKPALLIPFPYATGNHQLANAQTLEKKGAAKVCEERDLDPFKLMQILRNLMENPDLLESMKRGYEYIQGNPLGAAEKIVYLVKEDLSLLHPSKSTAGSP